MSQTDNLSVATSEYIILACKCLSLVSGGFSVASSPSVKSALPWTGGGEDGNWQRSQQTRRDCSPANAAASRLTLNSRHRQSAI